MEDCSGECGGDAVEDECGGCDGPGPSECWDGSSACDLSDCPDEPVNQVSVLYDSEADIYGSNLM